METRSAALCARSLKKQSQKQDPHRAKAASPAKANFAIPLAHDAQPAYCAQPAVVNRAMALACRTITPNPACRAPDG
jgi:hypothetical protein